jgi:hypothetical protein
MLAAIAVACRPRGAPHWDAPGVVAAIGRVSNLHLPDVAKAVIRCAEDATAKTPAPISNPSATCWREKTQAVAPIHPSPREACDTCGQREDHALHATDHPFQRPGSTPRGDYTAGVKLARSQMEDQR